MARENILTRTAADLERKYNFPSIEKAVKQSEVGITKINNTIENFSNSLDGIESQIDKKIVTWFYSGVPTLENEPANNWSSYEERNNHVADLYYDIDKGMVYKFNYNEEKELFEWLKLEDKDVIKSMAIANDDRDTDDHKRNIFTIEPTPPYDTGDIWLKENDSIYRCSIGRQAEDKFNKEDWVKQTDYSSETSSKNSVAQLNAYKVIVNTTYTTNAVLTINSDSIEAQVKTIERVATGNNTIFTDVPTTPYYAGDVYIIDEGKETQQIFVCQNDRKEGSFVQADWTPQSTYVSTATLKIESDNISQEVKNKVGDNEVVAKINAAVKGGQGVIDLSGNVVTIKSDNFKLNADGSIESTKGLIGGWDINDKSLSKSIHKNHDLDMYKAIIEPNFDGEDPSGKPFISLTKGRLSSNEVKIQNYFPKDTNMKSYNYSNGYRFLNNSSGDGYSTITTKQLASEMEYTLAIDYTLENTTPGWGSSPAMRTIVGLYFTSVNGSTLVENKEIESTNYDPVSGKLLFHFVAPNTATNEKMTLRIENVQNANGEVNTFKMYNVFLISGYYTESNLPPFSLPGEYPETEKIFETNFNGDIITKGYTIENGVFKAKGAEIGGRIVCDLNNINEGVFVNAPGALPSSFEIRHSFIGKYHDEDRITITPMGSINCRGITCTSLNCSGSKNRIVETEHYGVRALGAYETPTPYFGDIGSAKTDETGICRVDIEEIFKETIELENYKVFIQKLGAGDLYVKKYEDYFEVIGTPNLEFDYEIKGIQKGFANVRLEETRKEK